MKKRILPIFILFLTFTGINNTNAQNSIGQAQAVFLYNFTRLIEWPSDYKTGSFTIGIYGSSEVFNEVKGFCNGKSVGSQVISVVKFSNVEDIVKCHILFVSNSKTKELEAITSKIGQNKTLIISEKKGALEAGATINFILLEDKLKFELKASNATKNGLKINSNLENMAVSRS